jgi:8-oxo-dGTP pyrophosphatase MutT (NUDIX family)
MPLTLKVAIFMQTLSMPRAILSCGVLVFERGAGRLLLGHATGTARWDIPKGVADDGEAPLQAALRETAEETGLALDAETLLDLGRFAYYRGKDLHLYAALVEPVDVASLRCTSTFVDVRGRTVPEMDRFAWVGLDAVPQRCGKSMAALLAALDLPRLLQRLRAGV